MIGAGSVITRNIPPLSMALGVPARVVQNLTDIGVGTCDFNDTVDTLTEAMAFGRQMDRRDEFEMTRLTGALNAIQQLKKTQQQQQQPQQSTKTSACQPHPPSPGRRGSEPGCQSSLFWKTEVMASTTISMVVSIVTTAVCFVGLLICMRNFPMVSELFFPPQPPCL